MAESGQNNLYKSYQTLVIALILVIGLGGCAETSKMKKGAVIGASAGAVLGGIIGKSQDRTTAGVLIGTAVGGTAGAVIGRQMDKQAEELERELANAEIERIGDGIKITFDSAILFALNSSELSSSSKVDLSKLSTSLATYPNTNVLITGHTDSSGAEEYNQKLSEERASAAALTLLENGIPASRLQIVGHGELFPVVTNDTAEGRQKNRRVEIAIFASEELLQEAGSRKQEAANDPSVTTI
jgi:outer membrane protein OmpA-like peptidoglycan-associated protein